MLHQESQYENRFLESMYAELGRLAAYHLRNETLKHMWSVSDLIHESYIRILRRYGGTWVHHAQPAALWSRVMRNVLIDHARSCRAQKRAITNLTSLPAAEYARPADAHLRAAIHLAMSRLQKRAERQAEAVTLSAVYGFTVEETSAQLKVTGRTVKRDIHEARKQLRMEI